MGLKCYLVSRKLAASSGGRLSRSLAHHLDTCEQCKSEAQAYENMRVLLRNNLPTGSCELEWEDLKWSLASNLPSARPNRRILWIPAGAAAVIILLGFLAIMWTRPESPQRPRSNTRTYATAPTGKSNRLPERNVVENKVQTLSKEVVQENSRPITVQNKSAPPVPHISRPENRNSYPQPEPVRKKRIIPLRQWRSPHLYQAKNDAPKDTPQISETPEQESQAQTDIPVIDVVTPERGRNEGYVIQAVCVDDGTRVEL